MLNLYTHDKKYFIFLDNYANARSDIHSTQDKHVAKVLSRGTESSFGKFNQLNSRFIYLSFK